jgi:energy-converting hydrogenase Eha subunit C
VSWSLLLRVRDDHLRVSRVVVRAVAVVARHGGVVAVTGTIIVMRRARPVAVVCVIAVMRAGVIAVVCAVAMVRTGVVAVMRTEWSAAATAHSVIRTEKLSPVVDHEVTVVFRSGRKGCVRSLPRDESVIWRTTEKKCLTPWRETSEFRNIFSLLLP